MKRVIALLLVLVMVVCMLAACDDTTAETHVHTYRDTLSSDAEGHWYDASCTCTDVEVKKLAHADANNDAACDVCGFTNHTHTFAEGWTADCTNHWHSADCGHTVAGVGVAAHVDENKDSKCDVCLYLIEDIHEHYFATEWTGDAENHWHAALCEHGVEVADKEAHTLDDAGYCTVCEAKIREIDATSVEEVLKAAVARNNKVTGGKVQYSNDIYELDENNEPVVSYSVNNLVTYTLGNGHAYVNFITVDYEYGSTANQQWYELVDAESGEVFGVESLDAGLTFTPVMGDPAKLNGYNYTPSGLLQSFDNTSTLADTLFAIYTLSTQEGASNVEIEYDEEYNAFYIAYTYLAVSELEGVNQETGEPETVVNTNYYFVNAAFKTDANGVIDQAMILVDAFLDQEFDKDYDYDAETKTVTMLDTATPDEYAYMVMQTSGERTYTTAYPKASLVPSSFTVYDEMYEELGDTLTVLAGSMQTLYVGNFMPEFADPAFVNTDVAPVSIEFVNTDANNDYVPYGYYDSWENAIKFQTNEAGTFTMTITYEDMVKVVTVTAEVPDPESISTYVFSMVEEYDWMTQTTSEVYTASEAGVAQIAVGETLDFIVQLNPTAAAQEFTYEVNSDKATVAAGVAQNAVFNYELHETIDVLQFTATVDGIYIITFKATADETVTGKLAVIVGEPAGAESFDVEIGDMGFTMYEFTAPEAGTYLFLPAAGTELVEADGEWPGYDPISTLTLAEGETHTICVGATDWSVTEATILYINLDNAPIPGAPVAWGGMSDYAAPTQGSGTADDPYLIENAQHLAWLSRAVEDATVASAFTGREEVPRKVFSGLYFKQTADIDLNNQEFMPIGSYMSANSGNRRLFAGQYDGNNFKIMNAKVSMADHIGQDYYKNTEASNYVAPVKPNSTEGFEANLAGHYDALFNLSSGASVKNLNAVNIHTGNYDAEHTSAGAAGIIAGFVIQSTISNCTTDETSTAIATHAAGMAVCTYGSSGTTIDGCTNNATITGSEKAEGIIAYPLYTADKQENCTNNGEVVIGEPTYPDPNAWQGMTDYAAPTQGSGTEADPYLIENAQNLAWLAIATNDVSIANAFTGASDASRKAFLGIYFKQTADIDLGGLAFTPIGDYEADPYEGRHAFAGFYDGNGFAIKNATINACEDNGQTITEGAATNTYVSGIFGFISSGAIIENVNAKNIKVGKLLSDSASTAAETYGETFAGVIVGISAASTITNCTTDADCSAIGLYAGGIVAYQNGSVDLSYCVNNATVIGGKAAGGIVGSAEAATITYNVNYADVSLITYHRWCGVGGIIGVYTKKNQTTTVEVSYCVNAGNLSAIDRLSDGSTHRLGMGGIVGNDDDQTTVNYSNCFNVADTFTAKVDAVGNTTNFLACVGGLAGYALDGAGNRTYSNIYTVAGNVDVDYFGNEFDFGFNWEAMNGTPVESAKAFAGIISAELNNTQVTWAIKNDSNATADPDAVAEAFATCYYGVQLADIEANATYLAIIEAVVD